MPTMRAPLLDNVSTAEAPGSSTNPMRHTPRIADDTDEDFEEDDEFYEENDGTDEDDDDSDEADDDEDTETWQVSVSIPRL